MFGQLNVFSVPSSMLTTLQFVHPIAGAVGRAFGVTMMEAFTDGEPPYKGINNAWVLERVCYVSLVVLVPSVLCLTPTTTADAG